MVDEASWSAGRKEDGGSQQKREKIALIMRVNGLLDKLASDSFFQQDLNSDGAKKAIAHWTGTNRLSTEDAGALFDEDSYVFKTHIEPCLGKLRNMQRECSALGIPLPLDRIIQGKRTLFDIPNGQDNTYEKSISPKGENISNDVKPQNSENSFWRSISLNHILFVLIGICIAILLRTPMKAHIGDPPQ